MKTPAAVLAAALVLAPALPGAPPIPATKRDARVKAVVAELTPGLIALRRDLHAHPELGMRETRTAGVVAAYLKDLGLEVRTGIGGTGVVGILKGGRPGPVVAMRGDMDALPLTEETGLPFASKDTATIDGRRVGLMHACGHDVHTTLLLGVAAVLARLRADVPGTVVFIAQPGEEWGDGAAEMIATGLFRELKPEAYFAYHVDDTVKVGTIKYTPGWSGANVDGFELTIRSAGCHGADPSACVDPIVVGSQIVVGLQVLVAREFDVSRDTLITVGAFHAGTASNVIPREARLSATIRSYGEDQRALLKEKVTRFVTGTCQAAGATFDLGYYFGTPALYNDPALLDRILPTLERVLGGREHLVVDTPEMGGEDFSRFGKLAPAVMLSLGVVVKERDKDSVHSPTFLVDEDAIPLGVDVMSAVLLDYLHNSRHNTISRLPRE